MALVHVSNMLASILDTDFVVEQAHKVEFPSTALLPLAYLELEVMSLLKAPPYSALELDMCASISVAHVIQVGAKVLLDCSQSVPGRPTDVRALGADWIVATGHKMCGPTGIGFLWGR